MRWGAPAGIHGCERGGVEEEELTMGGALVAEQRSMQTLACVPRARRISVQATVLLRALFGREGL